MFNLYKQCAIALLALCAASAGAGVLRIDERSRLEQAGQISQRSDFDDFGAGFHFPGSAFERGGVRYTSAENLVVGAGSGLSIGQRRPVISNEYWSPISASIASDVPYTLFGFDAAVTQGTVELIVATNLGSYRFDGIALHDGARSLDFLGFQATGGEYFTGFELRSMGEGYLAGITNVALGSVRTAVPEPGSMATLLLGLGMLAAGAWRRRQPGCRSRWRW
ncbi:PEP-CTERM sorting domain-containing protein [Massilia scottii]|uniref:PEP-CTERM sorting domain-containing protein n=1 Tax=Massilia scottii TaxID=3057166 RepID=UPI0027968D8E|nr:PEP-CTERM sorting domain-containing protein [Massilia sp. CCM 9029]MDQ1833246.1 PEP-CTERM sorting domain-containing protein [Massilia sp. CCM 9029]